MRKSALFLLLVIGMHLSSLYGKSIHLLIMADDSDGMIGNAAGYNVANIGDSFSFLALTMNLPIHKKILKSSENSLTRGHLLKWIDRARVVRDDIVVIYYSGHGRRSKSSPTIWPYGCFLAHDEVEFTSVANQLFAKPAALYLILMDCCNVDPLLRCATALDIPRLKNFATIDKNVIRANCYNLFYKSKGLIMASASSPHQVGWYWIDEQDPDYPPNGFFTTHFLNSLFQELQNDKPIWKDLLRRARASCVLSIEDMINDGLIKDTQRNRGRPQYRVFLRPKRKAPSHLRKYLYERCLPTNAQLNPQLELPSQTSP